MRIAVIGPGGTGGYFGGLLARAGEDVTFSARRAQLEALRTRGLTLESRLAGTFTIPVQATDDPSEIGTVDLILFCVKTYDTDAAAESIRPLIRPDTMLVSLQNGIDNEERIARAAGPLIRDRRGGLRRFGDQSAGGRCTNSRAGKGRTRGAERGNECARGAAARGAAEGRDSGGAPPRYPGRPLAEVPLHLRLQRRNGRYPSAHWAHLGRSGNTCPLPENVGRGGGGSARRLPADCVAQALAAAVEPWARGSLYHDLTSGRRLELESLNGEVVRRGREYGVETPLNFAIYAALRPYVDGTPNLP
jgi:2-dehydropantoate 2-reductase